MRDPGTAVLCLPSVLTHGQAMACQVGMAKDWPAANTHANVWLDASALTQFDSSALAVLLSCRRTAQKAGQVVQVKGAPARLLQLARLYGVADLLNMQTEGPLQ